MSTPSSTPSRVRSRPNSRLAAAAGALAMLAAVPAAAQHVVFDPRNHLENALQAARQLESLANEARSLAASPYSHLAESRRSLQEMAELARTAKGLAATAAELERQFDSLYPDTVGSADLDTLLRQGRARGDAARRTAQDLAHHAAELDRLGQARGRRLGDAVAASEGASGQTAAVQSTNQILSVLAEDLAALRSILLAQSRLMAEQAARGEADRQAGDAARRRAWGRTAPAPAPPAFDPFARAGR